MGTAMTGLSGQDIRDKAAKTCRPGQVVLAGHPGNDREDGGPGHENKDRIA